MAFKILSKFFSHQTVLSHKKETDGRQFLAREVSYICLSTLWALSKNCEKRLLASLCLSIYQSLRLFAYKNIYPTGGIVVKSYTGHFLLKYFDKLNF